MTTQSKHSYKGVLYLFIGELIASALVVLGYICYFNATDTPFKWTVVSGALFGALVTTLNFLLLSFQINRVIDEYISLLDNKEMSDEDASEFAQKYSLKAKNSIAKSNIQRTALIIVPLVLAFISGLFDPIATLIPLLLYKPLIYIVELINQKRGE